MSGESADPGPAPDLTPRTGLDKLIDLLVDDLLREIYTEVYGEEEARAILEIPWPTPAPRPQPRSVYFIRNRLTGLVKIGASANIEARRQSLGGPAANYELLASTSGGITRERQLHRQFQADRMQGEWFRPSTALMALVDQCRTEQ